MVFAVELSCFTNFTLFLDSNSHCNTGRRYVTATQHYIARNTAGAGRDDADGDGAGVAIVAAAGGAAATVTADAGGGDTDGDGTAATTMAAATHILSLVALSTLTWSTPNH